MQSKDEATHVSFNVTVWNWITKKTSEEFDSTGLFQLQILDFDAELYPMKAWTFNFFQNNCTISPKNLNRTFFKKIILSCQKVRSKKVPSKINYIWELGKKNQPH